MTDIIKLLKSVFRVEAGSVVNHRHLVPRIKSKLNRVWRVFHRSLNLSDVNNDSNKTNRRFSGNRFGILFSDAVRMKFIGFERQ